MLVESLLFRLKLASHVRWNETWFIWRQMPVFPLRYNFVIAWEYLKYRCRLETSLWKYVLFKKKIKLSKIRGD
jgi:hypothetical protein